MALLNEPLLSEQWIQIGVTFIPIPHDLRGRKKEIEAEAAKRGIRKGRSRAGRHTAEARYDRRLCALRHQA